MRWQQDAAAACLLIMSKPVRDPAATPHTSTEFRQCVFGTDQSSDRRGYHWFGMSPGIEDEILGGLSRYIVSFGSAERLPEFTQAFSVHYPTSDTVALICHRQLTGTDHANRQGSINHHVLVTQYSAAVDYTAFLHLDNFIEVVGDEDRPMSCLGEEQLTRSTFEIADMKEAAFLPALGELSICNHGKQRSALLTGDVFRHKYCVTCANEEGALTLARAVWLAWRSQNLRLSFCSCAITPGVQANLRILTLGGPAERVEWAESGNKRQIPQITPPRSIEDLCGYLVPQRHNILSYLLSLFR